MYAWTMLITEFNCQSATRVYKTPLHSIIFTHHFILFLLLAMSAYGLVLPIFVMLKLPYLNYSKSLTMQPVLNFPKGSFGQRSPCTAASRANGLAAKWCWLHYDEAKGPVFSFCGTPMCLLLHFKYFTWFDIATMHAWIQLPVALVYVLMYYYGNTASSIRGNLTRSLSFIIISVWLFGEPKFPEILS